MPGLIRIYANPISGSRGARARTQRIAVALRRRGYAVQVTPTRADREPAEIARGSRERPEAVIAVGGDGTVRRVAAALAGTGIPLLVAPAGTENLVARYFGFTANDEALAEAVETGRRAACDVGVVGGQPFLLVAGFGFDGEIVARVHAARRGFITRRDYLAPIWRTFWAHRFPILRVEADGRPVCDGPAMVFVGNLPNYSAGLRLLHRARHDDGLLDLCILRCRTRVRLLRHAWRVFRRRHVDGPHVTYLQAKRIRVWSDEVVPFELDGDFGGVLAPPDGRTRKRTARRRLSGRADARFPPSMDPSLLLAAPRFDSLEFSIRPSALALRLPTGAARQRR